MRALMRHQRADIQHPHELPVFPVFWLYLFWESGHPGRLRAGSPHSLNERDAGSQDLETRLQKREQGGHAVSQKPGRHNHPLRDMEELLKIPKTPAGLLRSCLRV